MFKLNILEDFAKIILSQVFSPECLRLILDLKFFPRSSVDKYLLLFAFFFLMRLFISLPFYLIHYDSVFSLHYSFSVSYSSDSM